VKNGYSFSTELGLYYDYSLPVYAKKGATTISYFCNDAVGECSPSDIQGLNNSAKENGMKVLAFNEIDSFVDSYNETMMAAVDYAKKMDTDIIIIIDYDILCIDIVNYMRLINWTPRGLYFVDCNGDESTLVDIGEVYVEYASSSLSFLRDANYTSGNIINKSNYIKVSFIVLTSNLAVTRYKRIYSLTIHQIIRILL
jgi:hypothetical protein